jgi:XTP/dITP diphosphohydrolase
VYDVILATRNKGKAAEIVALLEDFNVRVRTLDEFPQIGDIPETGTTFAENALIKARTVAQVTGLTALADDSGLEVDALNGAPGVYSARFAGPGATDAQNNAELLRLMQNVPWPDRRARFVCVVAAHAPRAGDPRVGGLELLAEGFWVGRIVLEPAGNKGFGYDPLFLDEELSLTAAQMTPEQKNARSHRAAALRRLSLLWPDFIKKSAKDLDFSG